MRALLLLASLGLASASTVEDHSRLLTLPKLKRSFGACVRKTPGGFDEPGTLSALLECQWRFRLHWVQAYNQEKRSAPANASLDTLDDLQRKEVREYLARHPERAHTDDSSAQEPVAPVSAKPRARPEGTSRCGQDLSGLKDELVKSSDHGKLGITQEGGLRIVDRIECEQGHVSGDMTELLDHVMRDGPKLQHDTMLRLKRAAREAKDAGLDLGVEADMEKWLLDPNEDPPDDPNGPNPTAGENVN